jgi:CheY-like chemotaxis protein
MAKALIIDGDYKCTQAIELLIGDFGFETRTAETGQEGLNKLLSETPDVILCEDSLPDMMGSEFAREIRTNEKYSEFSKIPVISYGHKGKNARKITEAIQKYFPKLPIKRPE